MDVEHLALRQNIVGWAIFHVGLFSEYIIYARKKEKENVLTNTRTKSLISIFSSRGAFDSRFSFSSR